MNTKVLKIFTKERANTYLFSALFYGPRGTGKRYSVYNIICNCSPEKMKEKILSRKSSDILDISGEDGIQFFRETIPCFNTPSKELPHKWLIIRDLEFASKETQSYLLKTIEGDRKFHLFILSSCREALPPPLLSRLHAFRFSSLNKENLKDILSTEKSKMLFLRHLEAYPFANVFEIETFVRYEVEEYFTLLFTKVQNATEFMKGLDSFCKKLKDLSEQEKNGVVEFFLSYVIEKIKGHPEYSSENYQFFFKKVQKIFSNTLLSLNTRAYNPGINLENQLKSFLTSLFLLKKIL